MGVRKMTPPLCVCIMVIKEKRGQKKEIEHVNKSLKNCSYLALTLTFTAPWQHQEWDGQGVRGLSEELGRIFNDHLDRTNFYRLSSPGYYDDRAFVRMELYQPVRLPPLQSMKVFLKVVESFSAVRLPSANSLMRNAWCTLPWCLRRSGWR